MSSSNRLHCLYRSTPDKAANTNGAPRSESTTDSRAAVQANIACTGGEYQAPAINGIKPSCAMIVHRTALSTRAECRAMYSVPLCIKTKNSRSARQSLTRFSARSLSDARPGTCGRPTQARGGHAALGDIATRTLEPLSWDSTDARLTRSVRRQTAPNWNRGPLSSNRHRGCVLRISQRAKTNACALPANVSRNSRSRRLTPPGGARLPPQAATRTCRVARRNDRCTYPTRSPTYGEHGLGRPCSAGGSASRTSVRRETSFVLIKRAVASRARSLSSLLPGPARPQGRRHLSGVEVSCPPQGRAHSSGIRDGTAMAKPPVSAQFGPS